MNQYNHQEKYNNLRLELSGKKSNLMISDVRLYNEGQYSCTSRLGTEQMNLEIEG